MSSLCVDSALFCDTISQFTLFATFIKYCTDSRYIESLKSLAMKNDLLSSLVSVPSIFPDELKLANFLQEWAKKNTNCEITTQEVISGRPNVIFTKKAKNSSGKSILLAGHIDTVPVVEGWSQDPFTPVVQDGNMIGLGAWDMKAGNSVLLSCLEKFEPQNFDLIVAFTVDEENYSAGAHALIDGGFCKNVKYVLVPEPGFIHGDQGITIGRAGRASFMVKIIGKSAHGSYPQQGVNAITQAMTFLEAVKRLKVGHDEDMGDTIPYPRFIHSAAQGYSVPDVCELEIDCKMVPPDTANEMLQKLQTLAQEMFDDKTLLNLPHIAFMSRPTPFCSPYKLDRNSPFVKICEEVVTKVKGEAVVFVRESVADECIYVERLKVPAICIGPAGGNAHQANEFVVLKSVEDVEKIYLEILGKLDQHGGSDV